MTSFLTATSMTSIWPLPSVSAPSIWKSMLTSVIGNGMYCSASHWMESASSSSVIAGKLTFFMMTEWPVRDDMASLTFTPCSLTSSLKVLVTVMESIMEPSTIASGGSSAIPILTSSQPFLVWFICTSFMELEPMSKATASRFLANGKIITPPSIQKDLALFGDPEAERLDYLALGLHPAGIPFFNPVDGKRRHACLPGQLGFAEEHPFSYLF